MENLQCIYEYFILSGQMEVVGQMQALRPDDYRKEPGFPSYLEWMYNREGKGYLRDDIMRAMDISID